MIINMTGGGGGKAFTITATAGSHGTITPSGETAVLKGGSQQYTIAADTGYKIADVLVDGVSAGKVATYTFNQVVSNHTITVTFAEIKYYTITVTQATGGTISPGTVTLIEGSEQIFNITAATGYTIGSLIVDGTAEAPASTKKFLDLDADHTLTATFSITKFRITTTAGSNGSISPENPDVEYGSNKEFTFTPASGYVVEDVKVDGTSVGAVTKYTLNSVVATHEITATFKVAPTTETHSFTINKATLATSPTTCVSYESGYTAAKAYTWVMSKLHPSVVKNGTVNYFLDKSDLTKKADGTASKLDGTDGDVMVSIEPLWWKVTANTSTELTIQVSDEEISGGVTAHKFNGTVRKYLHMGMFNMSNSSANSIYNTTYSSTVSPWTNQTNDAFRTAAENRGDTYCTTTFLTWSLYQILCVFTSGSCECQTTIGQDYTSASTYNPVAISAMLTANGYTSSTKSSASVSLMYLFVANPWGNVYDFICGIKSLTTGTMGVAKDQKDARGVAITDDLPSTWEQFTTPGTSGYITEACGENYYPFLCKTGGGSSSTYYCDYGYTSKTKNYCAYVGGCYGDGAYAGVFFVYVSGSSSDTGANYGARLQCLDVNAA